MDPNPPPPDSNAPNNPPPDPNRPPTDPNAPNNPPPNPNRPPTDPNASNSLPPDTNAPNNPSPDPNRPPTDPNAPNSPPPDRNAPNREEPARSAPDRSAPDRSAPDRSAPDRSAPDRPPSDRPSPDRPSPVRNGSDRSAREEPAPERSAPDRFAPERSSLDRPAPEQSERSHPRDRSERRRLRPTHTVPKTLPKLPPVPPPGPSNETEIFEIEQQSWLKAIYNKETGEFCYRTPKSWVLILSYSTMYLLFLMTFTLTILYISLTIIKQTVDFNAFDQRLKQPSYEYLTYSGPGIGLTASPASEDNVPLIWYKKGEKDGYDKYVKAIDKFLWSNRRKREVSSLGPCGQSPYGYGEKPCIIIRINKKINWAGKPLNFNSTIAKSAPAEVQTWMRADKTKLWLRCSGFHSYDKEHIGKVRYYPNPPGFDASQFPLDAHRQSPLVAVQISDFTIGISLAIECKLWYDAGPSTFEFMLYVAPEDKIPDKSVNA